MRVADQVSFAEDRAGVWGKLEARDSSEGAAGDRRCAAVNAVSVCEFSPAAESVDGL